MAYLRYRGVVDTTDCAEHPEHEDTPLTLINSGESLPSAESVQASRLDRARAEARRRALIRGRAMADHDDHIERETHRLASQLETQEAAYEAWQNGRSHPDDPLYELIWRGAGKGVDSDKALDRLNRDRKVLDDLQGGVIDFTDIPGYRALGNTKELVVERLVERTKMYHEAMLSHGRNLTVNQANVARLRNNVGR